MGSCKCTNASGDDTGEREVKIMRAGSEKMKRTIKEAKKLIESLLPMQEKGVIFSCPRCGYDRMNDIAVRNALSRRANVYICSKCGMEEALLDAAGKDPLPFNEWGMVLEFDSEEGEDDKNEGEDYD